MARKDRLSAILIVLFSVLAACLALQLPIGKVGRPGPGIFPLVLSIVIGLLGLLLLLRTIRVKAKAGADQGLITRWRLGYLLGDLFLYASLFQPLGFLISTWLFLVLLKPVVKKGWIPVLFGSLLTSVAFFSFFNYLLRVELPMGILAK